jgi:hypothetical protein
MEALDFLGVLGVVGELILGFEAKIPPRGRAEKDHNTAAETRTMTRRKSTQAANASNTP